MLNDIIAWEGLIISPSGNSHGMGSIQVGPSRQKALMSRDQDLAGAIAIAGDEYAFDISRFADTTIDKCLQQMALLLSTNLLRSNMNHENIALQKYRYTYLAATSRKSSRRNHQF